MGYIFDHLLEDSSIRKIMTIKSEIRTKVIQMAREGKGRNEIAHELNLSNIQISSGSVSNILKREREGTPNIRKQPPQSSAQLESDASINARIAMNNAGSPSSTAPWYSGVGQAAISTNTNSSPVTSKEGGPLLSYFLDKDEDTTAVINPDSIPKSAKPSRDSSTKPKDPESDANVISQDEAPEEEEFEQYHQPQPQSSLSNSGKENPLGIDWDSEENWERRFWARAMEEREERRKELKLIQRRQQELDEQKRQIENIRQDLEARENKLRSVEDLIPSSKHLKDIGIGFDQALVWIDCIKEVAQKEGIDERTAAWKLADILRSFKELSDLEKAIQQARQQLAILNMVNDQQKRAINTLAHLQQIGMTEDEIGELVKLIGRWKGTAIGGISSMNGKLDDRLIGVN
jgi:soluble cytochrome b562